jgi:hypothetical protein
MVLKYVGAYPVVTHKGVSFDPNRPDKYTFLNAVVELLNIIDKSNDKDIKIEAKDHQEYNATLVLETLNKYCDNLEEIFTSKEKKVEEVIKNYNDSAKNNPNLSADEKRAILGNIAIMRDYYKQYMINEKAYECSLNALADLITSKHIDTITFIVGRNYGMVLSDLVQVLQDHKPPIDATMEFFTDDSGEAYGKLDTNRTHTQG